jgi:hypothetical protein
MLKISRIRLCEYNKSCSTLYNESNKNLVCIFLNFLRFSMHFTSFSKLGILLKMQFCAEAPRKSWGQAIGSLDPRGGGLAGIPAAPAVLPAGGGFVVDHMLT